MVDIVSKELRSSMMSRIRGKNTKPELLIRRGLFSMGFRYRLHDQKLPGRPDLVLQKYRTVVFVNGCFWHGHKCKLFRLPSTNTDFWQTKIEGNKAKDARNRSLLQAAGWSIITVWECAMRGRARIDTDVLCTRIAEVIRSGSSAAVCDIPHP